MIRTMQCTNGETCYAEECTQCGVCMHQDEAPVSETQGANLEGITVHVCGVKCRHVWDGPLYESEDGCICSVTCSKCGKPAIYVDMWEGR